MTVTVPKTTDLDAWRAFLSRFEIEFTEETKGQYDSGATVRLRMEEGSKKVGGYMHFYSDVEFDAEGRFMSIGAWE